MTRALLCAALATACASCALLSPPDAPRTGALLALDRAGAPAGPLLAGAARVDITPRRPVYMGGTRLLRTSEGVHDPIWARAIALRRGLATAVILSADLVGLHHHHVERVRDRLEAWSRVPRAGVLVTATHNHAGPDTLGMWGLPPLWTGIDDDSLRQALDGLARAAEEALGALEPVVVRHGQVEAPARGISRNRRDPDLIDRTLTAVAFDAPDGRSVATLVHFACHPEAVSSKNHLLSADFPQALYETVEAARPGVALLVQGPLGGMVTVDARGRTFEEARRIGAALGRLALDALEGAPPLRALDLRAVRQPLWLPVQNRRYHLGAAAGIFAGRPFEEGHTPSEVQALRLGPITLLGLPGEVLPRLGFELEEAIAAPVPLVASLANDEVGYLLHEDDHDEERFAYERTVSPGPQATRLLRDAARRVIAALDEDPGARRE